MREIKDPESGHMIWLIDEACPQRGCYELFKDPQGNLTKFCLSWIRADCAEYQASLKPYLEFIEEVEEGTNEDSK